MTESTNAKSAGATNQCPVLFFAHKENRAPINGPIINPRENAIPTKA